MTDDVRPIEHLLYEYAECIDAGRLDDLAALFEHGCIHPVPDAAPDAILTGRDAVRSMYDGVRMYEDGTPKTKHVTTNAVIEIADDGSNAVSRSHYTVTQSTTELPLQIIITGHYDDTFHRVDSRWWFRTRVMHVDQAGDLSHHLTFEIPRS